MSERAIDKMIKELEAELASHEDRYGRELTRHHIERARRLALEEAKERSQKENVHVACTGAESEQAKEKPTLIIDEDLPNFIAKTIDEIRRGWPDVGGTVLDLATLTKIWYDHRRYRPSTQADIVGEFREWLEEAKKNGDARFYNEFKDAEEIIRKYEGEK